MARRGKRTTRPRPHERAAKGALRRVGLVRQYDGARTDLAERRVGDLPSWACPPSGEPDREALRVATRSMPLGLHGIRMPFQNGLSDERPLTAFCEPKRNRRKSSRSLQTEGSRPYPKGQAPGSGRANALYSAGADRTFTEEVSSTTLTLLT